jgi:predicted transcriptional regulator of viral defense system
MIKQEQKVIEYFIQNNNAPKHFEEVAEDLEILIPNVRRILGQGTLKGTFKRVAIGVYEFAHYETEEDILNKPAREYTEKDISKLINISLKNSGYINI